MRSLRHCTRARLAAGRHPVKGARLLDSPFSRVGPRLLTVSSGPRAKLPPRGRPIRRSRGSSRRRGRARSPRRDHRAGLRSRGVGNDRAPARGHAGGGRVRAHPRDRAERRDRGARAGRDLRPRPGPGRCRRGGSGARPDQGRRRRAPAREDRDLSRRALRRGGRDGEEGGPARAGLPPTGRGGPVRLEGHPPPPVRGAPRGRAAPQRSRLGALPHRRGPLHPRRPDPGGVRPPLTRDAP